MKRAHARETDVTANLLAVSNGQVLSELVQHLRRHRAFLCEEWVRRICQARLLATMTQQEILSEVETIYDNYVKTLQTGSVRDLQAYASDLSRRFIDRGFETRDVLGIVLLLRDVLARSLFQRYHRNFLRLTQVLDSHEPAANRIANTVAVSFMKQREGVIRRQQKAIQTLHVREEERKRISRELHDEIGHALTEVLTHLAGAKREWEREPESLFHTKLADIEQLLIRAMDRIHSFARELRPAMLDDLGLSPTLRSYLTQFAERTGLRVRFERPFRDAPMDEEGRTALFRIAQESLTNIAKHAEATEVDVALGRINGSVQLQIKDNGKGFAPNGRHPHQNGKRLGLLGMQERMGLVNGHLQIQSEPGKGTVVVAEIPLGDATRENAA